MPNESLVEILATIPDPRGRCGKIHPLTAVLSLTVVATLAGMKTLEAIAQFGRDHGLGLAHALGFRRAKTPTKSIDRKSTRLNSSHITISYAVFCLKKNTSSINLFGARGETVDTQVVVRAPAGGLTNVNLSATALAGPNGVTIPASEVTLYREHHVTVTGTGGYGGGSNPPLGPGTYPEPLMPVNDPESGAALCGTSAVLKACNASVSSGQNQPY